LIEGETMRIPTFIAEHPLEALIGGVLLLVLIFGSADRHAVETAKAVPGAHLAAAGKL
jgi:hypothetical protein